MQIKTSAHRSDLILLTAREVKGLLEGKTVKLPGVLLACDTHWDLDYDNHEFKLSEPYLCDEGSYEAQAIAWITRRDVLSNLSCVATDNGQINFEEKK